MKKKLILTGAGGHAKACIDVIEQTGCYDIAGLLDIKEKIGEKVLGYPIIGSDEDIPHYIKKGFCFLVTLGQIKSAARRRELFELLKKNNADIVSAVSPRAYVSKYAKIGAGTIVMHDALVNAGAVIGENCIINSKALIEHDVKIGNCCHIAGGASVYGGAAIEDEVFIGGNASVVQGAFVPYKSFIKASSIFI